MTKLAPEIFGHLRDGVDSNTIKAVVADEVLNPVFELLTYPAIFLLEIRETSESAVLNLPLVAPVVNVAVVVIVRLLIEGVN